MNEFAVVIPAYNEQATIRDIASRSLAVCPRVIVVDDGSSDHTADALAGLPVELIVHERNQGKAISLWDGLQAAMRHAVEAVITLDGDGQHRPEDIPRLLEAWQRHRHSIVIGSRLAEKAAFPPTRYYANRFANFWISWASGYPIGDSQSGFRLYPTGLLVKLQPRLTRAKGFVFESEILIDAARLGFRSVGVPIAAIYGESARPSHFHGLRDITFITRMVAGKLLSRGMYPQGLFRVLMAPHFSRQRLATLRSEGVTTLLLSLLVIAATVGTSLLVAWAHTLQMAYRGRAHADSNGRQLVLGRRLHHDAVTPDYAARLQRALERWQQDPARKILILGGTPNDTGISEARAGRDYLIRRGMPDQRIDIEEQSRNTLENLRQARDALRASGADQPAVIVTSRYHLARTAAMARGLGLRHQMCAAEDRLRLSAGIVLELAREAFHVHWYYVGYLWAHLTANKRMLARIR